MTDKVIGVVGVGLMGHGIARNIQKNGWQIGFYDHAGNQPCEDLLEHGATTYNSLAQLGASSDVVVICVTGSPQVESVLTASDGLLAKIRNSTVIIDCSTAVPDSTRKLAALVHDKGGRFLDAPMTRTPKEAAEGRLNLIIGGEQTLFDEQKQLLQAFAENITYAGPVGAGHTMKLLHNYVSLGFSAVLAEAAAAANKSSIDPQVLLQVLNDGGGAGIVLDRMTPFMETGEVSSFAFTLANSTKDLEYYNEMCANLKAEASIAKSIHNTFATQVNEGNAESYLPRLIEYLSNQ